MALIADPMIALQSLQEELNRQISYDYNGYVDMYDEPNGGKRYSFAKIINKEVQVVSIFGLEDKLDGFDCYNVGYAVKESHRGCGLALEAVNRGVDFLKNDLKQLGFKSFYLEAVIGITNVHSIKVAEKIFPTTGERILERESGEAALHFKRLISIFG